MAAVQAQSHSGEVATVVSVGHRVPAAEAEVPTDRELVLAYQDGSCSAFVQIYRRHRGSAEAVCRRHLHPTDVEDAVQETMLRAIEGLMRFNGDYALRAWINRIAANVCLDVLRKRRRRTSDHRLELVTGDGAVAVDPSEVVESLMEAEEVGAAFAGLPDRQQLALFLRGVEGRSHVEIAATLGISAAQVKAVIHRARLSLRRHGSRRGWGRGVLALVPWGRNSELGGLFRRFPHLAEHSPAMAGSPALAQSVNDGYRVLATALVATVATVVGTGAVPLERAPGSHGRAHGFSLAEEPVLATASPAEVVITSTGEVMRGGRGSEPSAGPLTGPAEAVPVTGCHSEVGGTADNQLQPGSECSSSPPVDGSPAPAVPTAADVAPPGTPTTLTAGQESSSESSPGPALLTPAVTSAPRWAARPAVSAVARAPVAQSRPAVPAAARAPVAPPRPDAATAAARGAPAAAPRSAGPDALALEAVPPADVPETGPGAAQHRHRPGA